MKLCDSDALIAWALYESKLLTIQLVPKLPCALLFINDNPTLTFLIRTGMPLTKEVRALILEAFFQENQMGEEMEPSNIGPDRA